MHSTTAVDRFPTVRRGYDPDAVESHLSELAATTDATLDEAAARIAALESDLHEARRHEEAVHLTILAATKTKEDMLEAAKVQADEIRAQGRKDGDRIITEARMQAFRLVTEARTEAGDIVAEARAEAAAIARVEAESTPAAAPNSEREELLQQRIEDMQTVIEAMEAELRNRYSPPTSIHHDDAAAASRPVPSATGNAPVGPETPSPLDPDAYEEHIEIVVTESTPPGSTVEPPPPAEWFNDRSDEVDEPAIGDAPPAPDPAGRRSFYSRRSANLPSIGAEAGRGAMAAVAGLRSNLVGSPDASDGPTEAAPRLEVV